MPLLGGLSVDSSPYVPVTEECLPDLVPFDITVGGRTLSVSSIKHKNGRTLASFSTMFEERCPGCARTEYERFRCAQSLPRRSHIHAMSS